MLHKTVTKHKHLSLSLFLSLSLSLTLLLSPYLACPFLCPYVVLAVIDADISDLADSRSWKKKKKKKMECIIFLLLLLLLHGTKYCR
jgi:hypothetical protein